MHVIVELVAMSCCQVAISQLGRPVSPRQETLVRIGKIGLFLVHDAAETFKHFALSLDGFLHLRIPWQAEIFEHGNANAVEVSLAKWFGKFCAGLLNRDR